MQNEHDLKKINHIVNDLHLSNAKDRASDQEKSATTEDNTDNKMDIDAKESPLYGDYNIYGVESPDAEDWVNRVLESSQIEFLSNLKRGKAPASSSITAKANENEFTKRINAFQNQLNKISSEESTPYGTNGKNSPTSAGTDSRHHPSATKAAALASVAANNGSTCGTGPVGLLYGYSFYSDEFNTMTNSDSKLSKEMDQQLKHSYGVRSGGGGAAGVNSKTENKTFRNNNANLTLDSINAELKNKIEKTHEINEEYDLLSELNNLQNFQFYLNNKSGSLSGGGSAAGNGLGSSAKLISMDRNDSAKSTNSTQTMISSNSSNPDRMVTGIFLNGQGGPQMGSTNNINSTATNYNDNNCGQNSGNNSNNNNDTYIYPNKI